MESSAAGPERIPDDVGLLALVAVVAIASRGSTSSGEDGARRPTEMLLDILLSLYLVVIVAGAFLFLYGADAPDGRAANGTTRSGLAEHDRDAPSGRRSPPVRRDLSSRRLEEGA